MDNGVGRRSISTGFPRPSSSPMPITNRSHKAATSNPPSVKSIRTKPGARAVTLHVAQAGSAAASDLGQPSSRKMTAPGRTRTAYVAAANFTGVSRSTCGSRQTTRLTARLARTNKANGTPRSAASPAWPVGAEPAASAVIMPRRRLAERLIAGRLSTRGPSPRATLVKQGSAEPN
jgi:hypothetical protein